MIKYITFGLIVANIPNLVINDYKSHVVVNGVVTFWMISTSGRTTKHVRILMAPSYNWTPPKIIIKGNHRLFIIGIYEIWCKLYKLPKVMCFWTC